MGKPTFGYWDIRGLAEPVRYLLHYKQVSFEDKRYTPATADDWLKKDKFSLGLDFPNLPYYIDKDVKLTQSTTILRYLAAKYDLEGKTKEQKLRASLVEQQILDVRSAFFRVLYDEKEKFETAKAEFLPKVHEQVKWLDAFLGERRYLAGDELTYVDFLAYDILDMLKYLAGKYFEEFPRLKAYLDRVRSLPELQDYVKSSTYKRWPIVSVRATFGGSGPEPK